MTYKKWTSTSYDVTGKSLTFEDIQRAIDSASNIKRFYFTTDDGKLHLFNLKHEFEAFEARYKHDKNFNNKLTDLISE